MRAAEAQPILQCPVGGQPERHRSFLVALAEYPDQPARTVDIVDIEPAQFADPNTGGVQHLHDQAVPQGHRITLGRSRFRGRHGSIRLIPAEYGGQRSVRARRSQARTGIDREMTGVCQPSRESAGRRGTSSHGRSRGPARGQIRQPRSQQAEIDLGHRRVGRAVAQMGQQRTRITEIGAHRMRRPIATEAQMPLVLFEQIAKIAR